MRKIFNFIENKIPYEKWKLDPNDQTDKFLSRIKKTIKIHDVTNTLILSKNNTEQIILPRSTVSHYLHICHDDMEHSGVDRIQYLLRHCTWSGKFDDIQNYVSSCSTCLQRKGSYMQKSKIPLKNLNHGSKPFEYITVDFVHMPQSKTGKKYILTIMCNFSRWLYCHPTFRDRGQDAVSGLKNFILEYGVPKVIGSDRGVHFVNDIFSKFCGEFKIRHNIHAAYRPQSSGQLERVHRTLKNSLWILCHDLQTDWEEMLPYARRAHNINFNKAIKCSPHFCVFGREPDVTGLFLDIGSNLNPVEHGHKTASFLKKAHAAVKLAQAAADIRVVENSQIYHKPTKIYPGDDVYIKRDQSISAKTNHLNWVGPYKVLNVNDTLVHIKKSEKIEDFIHRTQVVKVVDRYPALKPVLVLPQGKNVAAESEGVSERETEMEDAAVDKISPRCRKPPERIQINPKLQNYA